ncbi:hypothetical protein F4803DRAFT_576797 [Xylaria telfairii]|nr:hypothetical protein F4803DRAFT_576797 [Xylaria telfairii]
MADARKDKIIVAKQTGAMTMVGAGLLLALRVFFGFVKKIFSSAFWVVTGFLIFVSVLYGGVSQMSAVGSLGSYLPPPISHHQMNFPNADVLAVKENTKLGQTDFRLLVNLGPEKVVKYATVSLDVLALGVRKHPYSSTNVVQMPNFPSGDYCSVQIGVTPDGTQTFFTTTSCQPRASAEGAWHMDNFNFLDLEIVDWSSSTDNVKLVRYPSLDSSNYLAVMKYAPFAHTIENISRELQLYQHLYGSGVAPKYLGQVVEQGRVIGFLMEYIEGARPVSRVGAFSDLALDKCKQTLAKLHTIGVTHNYASSENCLIRPNGNAVLIDFKHATLASGTLSGFPNREDIERDFQSLTSN